MQELEKDLKSEEPLQESSQPVSHQVLLTPTLSVDVSDGMTTEQLVAIQCPIPDSTKEGSVDTRYFKNFRVQDAKTDKLTNMGFRQCVTVDLEPFDSPVWHVSVSVFHGNHMVPSGLWTKKIKMLANSAISNALKRESGAAYCGQGAGSQKLLVTAKCIHLWVPLTDQEKEYMKNVTQ